MRELSRSSCIPEFDETKEIKRPGSAECGDSGDSTISLQQATTVFSASKLMPQLEDVLPQQVSC
jgi:hypothetical protein